AGGVTARGGAAGDGAGGGTSGGTGTGGRPGVGLDAVAPEPGGSGRTPVRGGACRGRGARYSTAPVHKRANKLRSVSSAGRGVRWNISRAVRVPSTRDSTNPSVG